VQFRYDQEHLDLQAAVRAFLAEASPDEAVRQAMDSASGWAPEVWRRLCDELELPALAVPEDCGGSGFGLVELGLVLAEAGRSLLCAPLLATCLAAQALLRVHPAHSALPELARGLRTGTLAFREPGRVVDAVPETRAAAGPAGWTVSGVKDWVLGGESAELLVVSARTAAGTALFLVEAGSPGCKAQPIETVDPTRRAARVTFEEAPGDLLGVAGTAPVRAVLDVAAVLVAAEQVGIAERCLADAVGYAGMRTQFGRPVGSFQAVKHALADVLLEVEAARSSALYAALATDQGRSDTGQATAVAAYTCSEAALLAAGENIQVHGGIGMTWEHPAHLLLRRATVNRMLLGGPEEHLARMFDHVEAERGRDTSRGTTPSNHRRNHA